jgi:hypothetical protein
VGSLGVARPDATASQVEPDPASDVSVVVAAGTNPGESCLIHCEPVADLQMAGMVAPLGVVVSPKATSPFAVAIHPVISWLPPGSEGALITVRVQWRPSDEIQATATSPAEAW